jgi:hypothetical protein
MWELAQLGTWSVPNVAVLALVLGVVLTPWAGILAWAYRGGEPR